MSVNVRRLIFASLVFFANLASASFTAPASGYFDANYNGVHFQGASSAEACGKAAAAFNDTLVSFDTYQGLGQCNYQKAGGGQYNYITSLSCPANSHSAGGNSQCACDAGFEEKGASCVLPAPPKCPAGDIKTVNFTSGWTRTGGTGVIPDSDYVGKVSMPGMSYKSSCVAGCIYSIGIDATTNAWVSTVPSSQGLYRNSVDALVVSTGAECTVGTDVSDTAAVPDPAPAPCPGFVGQVNGKTTCVGTASTPLPKPSGDVDAAARALNTTGDNGNPAAGTKPSTGEGSGTGGTGRTPGTGSGTASGGPIAAAAGGKGASDGTTGKPAEGKEQQNCGAPGQPQCKIDETGTPKGDSAFDSLKAAIDKDGSDTAARIEDAKGLNLSSWSWTFALPTGCTAYTLTGFNIGGGAFIVDVCQWQPMIHDLMALIWIGATVWCCIGMVGRTVRGA